MLTRTSALETPVSSPEEARALQQHRLCVYTKTSEDNIGTDQTTTRQTRTTGNPTSATS